MHPRSFVAGCVIVVIALIGALVFFGGGLSRDLPETLMKTASQYSPFGSPATPPPEVPEADGNAANPSFGTGEAARIAPRTELVVQRPMTVKTPYGLIKLDSGMRVVVLRETAGGVLVKVGGQECVVPLIAFNRHADGPGAPAATPRPLTAAIKAALPPVQPPAFEAPASIPPSASELPAAPTPPIFSADTAASFAGTVGENGVSRFSKWLLIATGDEGRGTASIINIHGTPTIVTNAHVISGNGNVKFRRMNSQELPYQRMSISQDYDLAIAAQTEVPDGIPMLEDVDNHAAIGDDVVVLGNSLGSGVVTQIPGKINGIGPDLIEVDAKFVEGNSGSPIIHVKTGKVIGIATFAVIRKLSSFSKDSQFSGVRRFGYRIDTAKRWEQPRMDRFAEEAATLKQLRHMTDSLVGLATDIFQNGRVTVGAHQEHDDPLRGLINSYLSVVDGRTKVSPSDIVDAKQRLLRSVQAMTMVEFKSRDFSNFTAYHRKEVDEEKEARKFLEERFARLLDVQDATRAIQLP